MTGPEPGARRRHRPLGRNFRLPWTASTISNLGAVGATLGGALATAFGLRTAYLVPGAVMPAFSEACARIVTTAAVDAAKGRPARWRDCALTGGDGVNRRSTDRGARAPDAGPQGDRS